MFAHAAARHTAVLAEAAIRAGVFLKEDQFFHFLYYKTIPAEIAVIIISFMT
jgi:hypothetical protein